MSIPNCLSTVEATKNDYPRAWSKCHVAGDPEAWDFIILLCKRLYAIDPLFGLNGKRGNPDDMSWDAVNWRGSATDPPNVIDVVAGAGGSNPQPSWQVTNTTGAWIDPRTKNTYYNYGTGGGNPPKPIPPPAPKYPPYPGDAAGNAVGQILFSDYERAGQAPNPGMGTWFNRVMYDALTGMGYEESVKKHRVEWCSALGIPVQ